MAILITCPHCSKIESWREGDAVRTHCRFCELPLTGPMKVASTEGCQPEYPAKGIVLKSTLGGGGCGGALAVATMLLANAAPLLVMATAFARGGLNDEKVALLGQDALSQLVNILVSAAIGFSIGALMMAVASVLLHSRPMLMRAAWLGAVFGAFLPLPVIFVVFTLPLVIARVPSDPVVQAAAIRHFFLALCLSAISAPLGLVALVVVRALIEAGQRAGTTDL